ncbi:hypothetical protein BGZ80_004529 [Entomortierella chlamydospora]|uniref:Uncharacterized protein n=1 Tax=Entomortierella chlamydospora TaxID=101097 RepID=A0A9P6T5D2_9FUNG|nr:hypothetical protein BGZ79_005058 [Entomortierella chlamydospora]KAG0024289.1 hypothetical protein BGZ80_004529 [Entomortierella chlamydospora]
MPTENVSDLEPSIDSAILRYLRRLERNQTVLENTVKNQEQTIQQQKTEMAELRTELAYINGIKGKTHTKCQARFHENTPASTSSHNPPYQPSYNWREAEEIILCLKEEVMEEVIEEVVLEARGNAIEEIITGIKKEILDEVIGEAVTETVEEFRVREIVEELMITVKQEVMEEVIEEVIMEISEEVREEANVEVMVEVMEDVGLEAKEKVTEENGLSDETTTRVDAMEDTRARIRKAEEDELDEEPKKKRHLRSYVGVELVDSWETDAAEQSNSVDYQGRMTDSYTDSFSSGTPSLADYSETSTPKNQEEAQNLVSQFDTENSNHQPDTHTGAQDTDSQTNTHTRSPNRQDDTYTQGAAEHPS